MNNKTTKKKKKNVQFTSPEITDTIYRPKTSREDVNSLYFQEEELLDWEYDEETTVRDRFEVIVTEIDDMSSSNSNNETSNYSMGTPIISFYNSYSYSFQEDDYDEMQSGSSSVGVSDHWNRKHASMHAHDAWP